MNIISHSYLLGKQAAAATFAPVAPPVPKPPQAAQTQTAATPGANLSKAMSKAPASMGIKPAGSIPGMANAATGSSTASSGSSLMGQPSNPMAGMSALQFAQQTISQGNNVLGPLPKMAEFNFGVNPDPAAKPDPKGTPAPDNGRRIYGTQFTDALRPARDVDQAFNALSIPKPTDVLNEMGQAEFGAPNGMTG